MVAGIQSAHAFALLGPGAGGGQDGDAWQTPEIGYGYPGSFQIGQPKNIGEEYRWNKPVLYYACDANFVQYFGSNGVAAVDAAFTLLNNAFTNNPTGVSNGLDGYSSGLTELPLEAKEINYTAQALNLRDVKSIVMRSMAEELGLADAEQYVWTLRLRQQITPGPTCPDNMNYLVVQRNFDPVTFTPSSYVNGTLFSYVIAETCKPPNPLALALPFTVDPLADTATPIAGVNWPDVGQYFTGLTYDDVGGLRYLLTTNNLNTESPGSGTSAFTLATNTIPSLTTLDLSTFLNLLPSTDPNTLLGLYPNLVITSVTTNYFITNSSTTVLFLTNYPWLPSGFGPVLVLANQSTPVVATNYSYTFANVVTNHFFTNWPTVYSVSNLTVAPNSPANDPILVFSRVGKAQTLRGPGGDFYILPPNVIGYILGNQIITNKGSFNVIGQIISVSSSAVEFANTTFFFTNYTYVNVKVIQLVPTANNPGLFQGVEKITFVRRDFDSLIGGSWIAVSNNYTLKSVVGAAVIPRFVQRVITAPDILITAFDIPPFVVNGLITPQPYQRSEPNWNKNLLPRLAGPGTIEPSVTISFNTEAPVYYNTSAFLTQPANPTVVYGSFDGTTNAPVVYPDGTSLANLENQILMQVTTTSLPDGTNGVVYNGGGFQLTGSGGSPPYTWDLVGSALPPNLSLSSDGIISGTPVSAATFDFTVRMTDIGARSVQQDFSITIHP